MISRDSAAAGQIHCRNPVRVGSGFRTAAVILKPGDWVRLRCDESYNNPWDVVGIVAEVNTDRMEACVRFSSGEPWWIPVVDLILIK